MQGISENHMPMAAEDRFLLVSVRDANSLCPHTDDAEALREAIRVAGYFLGDLIPVFDLRGLPALYNDVDAFLEWAGGTGSHVLVNPATAQQIDIDSYAKRRGLHVLSVKGHSYTPRSFNLSHLRHGDMYLILSPTYPWTCKTNSYLPPQRWPAIAIPCHMTPPHSICSNGY